MTSCQQDELYRAEDTVLLGREALTGTEAQALADRVRSLPWFLDRFPKVMSIEVEAVPSKRGSVGAFIPGANGYGHGRCEMHPAHMCPLVVLHEISHVLCEARYGPNGHGPHFARIFLQLAYLAGSSDLYKALFDAFERGGIDHNAEV